MIYPLLFVFLALLTSTSITAYIIPAIIKIARSKNLTDAPDNNRKIHKDHTPTLGGIAIFLGFIISFSLWIGDSIPVFYPFLVAGATVLFTIGVKDDIFVIAPGKKFLAQGIAAAILVVGGKVRLYHLDGFLGYSSLTEIFAIVFTIFAFLAIINAYNLIDGVDGLAGVISFVGTLFFGIWFFINGHFSEAVLAASLGGALIGFLYHNMAPAKIFMGDTGSLVVGLIMAVMSFRLIELNAVSVVYSFESPMVFALALLIIPLYDTLRIIIVRVIKGKSPFQPDRNHIHHELLGMGFGHRNICRFLSIAHFGIIAIAIILYRFEIHAYLFSIVILTAMIIPAARVMKRWQHELKHRLVSRVERKTFPFTPLREEYSGEKAPRAASRAKVTL
jgi:UDP-GlcNAc:undecaprenyl-phosphate/decaprenyl-phosphate GlcNAc-1-phosphate transferase